MGKNEKLWQSVLTAGETSLSRKRHIIGLLPSNPRCRFCNVPFSGVGGIVTHWLFHKRPSNMNPNFCNACETMARKFPGGAEVTLTMLFADVRGSTSLAEKMSPLEFSHLLNRFYAVATESMTQTDALIDKFVGDEVIGLYITGFAGEDHAKKAIKAARDLLFATGHNDLKGPWLPVGVGVHTGTAFVGSVGSKGVYQITALGDAVNTTARLASNSAKGEILVTKTAAKAAGLNTKNLEKRKLNLKGKNKQVDVNVISISPQSSPS